MEGVRHRRAKGDSASPNKKKKKAKKSSSESVDRTCTVFVILSILALGGLVAAMALYPTYVPRPVSSAVDLALSALRLQAPIHAVVLDAGSTGSRVLAFTFHRGLLDGRLRLDDELWHEVKPGLSGHAEDPSRGAQSIEQLLELARTRVPEDKRSSTPVSLKATAGLRLLPEAKSKAILREVEATLQGSGFRPAGDKPVEIMDPTEEGVFGWFTVNFLAGKLVGEVETLGEESFATLDLGGGSTQISFAAPGDRPLVGMQGRRDYLHQVSVLGEQVRLYSHSYLGLGLMAARMAIFSDGNPQGATELKTPCMTSQNPVKWTYQGKEYTILNDKASIENCIRVATKVVNAGNVHVPEGLADRPVAAFSYFFDRASEIGLVPQGATEGAVTVKQFIYEAGRACDPHANPNSGFYCADLAFISSLLSRGYGLPQDKEVQLFKKVEGHEASWALGLAYKTLEEEQAAAKKKQ